MQGEAGRWIEIKEGLWRKSREKLLTGLGDAGRCRKMQEIEGRSFDIQGGAGRNRQTGGGRYSEIRGYMKEICAML